MASMTRIELIGTAPFHFGRRGVGLNETTVTLPADTLFSALCTAMAAIRGKDVVEAMLGRFPSFAQTNNPEQAHPPFRITSLMPSAAGIDLFPMPHLLPKITQQGMERRKAMKDIAWVSRTVFGKLVAGEELTGNHEVVEQRSPQHEHPYTVQGGDVWVTADEQRQLGGRDAVLWETDTRPRVTVDRTTGASAAFSSGSVHFAHKDFDVHLYALIRWEEADAELRKDVSHAFVVLGENGIGGERGYGHGQFQPNFTEAKEIPGATEGDYWTTLSPYLPQPAEQEVFKEGSRYAIVLRRGWLSLPGHFNLRRPTIRMVDSGSVLHRLKEREAVGCMGDATPGILQGQIRIQRYGLAWPVRVANAALDSQ
jgi:CRISPR-associated protein Csm4